MSTLDQRGRAISGSLEDVVVSDVLQFIQLGKRSGTLVLRRRGETATVAFHDGRMIAATAPRTPKVMQTLVSAGLFGDDELNALSEASREAGVGGLAAAVCASGRLDRAALQEVITAQLEQAVAELLRWETGTFDFVLGDLTLADDLLLLPEGHAEETADPKAVLVEATRIFDARSRRTPSSDLIRAVSPAERETASERRGEPPREATATDEEIDGAVDLLVEGGPRAAGDMLELQVVSPDEPFIADLAGALEDELASVRRVAIQGAGEAPLGAPAPIVLLDLRAGGIPVELLSAVRSARPSASVVALVETGSDFGRVYASGALAAVPGDVGAVVACVENIIENRTDLVRGRRRDEGAVGRLRRMLDDLRSGAMSASMALNLMHVISESVERAILFLVRSDTLAVLGAFGHDASAHLLASSTRGLRLPLSQDNVLTAAVRHERVVTETFSDAGLPDSLRNLLGEPKNPQVVVFPVLGAERVVAVVYTDNGRRSEPVEDIEILELAAAQVGIAFENDLLRRQLRRG